jgi:hypothetical protein
MAQINDSYAGRYTEPFRDAAVRFLRPLESEFWEIRGFESPGRGMTIEMRHRTQSVTHYSLFVVPPSQTLAADILQAMNDLRQSFSQPTTGKNSYGQTV